MLIFWSNLCLCYSNHFLHLCSAATRHCFLPQARLASARVSYNEMRRYQVWVMFKAEQYRSNIVQYQIIFDNSLILWYQDIPESATIRWWIIKFEFKVALCSSLCNIVHIFHISNYHIIRRLSCIMIWVLGCLGIYIYSGILHKHPIKYLIEQLVFLLQIIVNVNLPGKYYMWIIFVKICLWTVFVVVFSVGQIKGSPGSCWES